jgi:plasmid maintenance system antidote protein VapI
MFNPPHPGLTLKDDVWRALGLTVTQSAQQLGVSRDAVASAQWADWHLA